MTDLDLYDLIRQRLPRDTTPLGTRELLTELCRQNNSLDEKAVAKALHDLEARGEIHIIRLADGDLGAHRAQAVFDPGAGNENDADWTVERNLYAPFLNYIRLRWSLQAGLPVGEFHHMEVIGDGRTEFDRPFSIPDLIVLNGLRYRWLPQRELEIHTFELKTSTGGSERDVYQAYAYTAFAHNSWMGWHIKGVPEVKVSNALEVARRTGVGLIVCVEPRDYETFHILAMPRRANPSLAAIDQLIDLRLSAEGKALLGQWLGRN